MDGRQAGSLEVIPEATIHKVLSGSAVIQDLNNGLDAPYDVAPNGQRFLVRATPQQ